LGRRSGLKSWFAAAARAFSRPVRGLPGGSITDSSAAETTRSAISPWPTSAEPLEPPAADTSADAGFRPFRPGDCIAGRFQIAREIAQGGMGVVYLAIDLKLNQPRALKCAKQGYADRLTPEACSALQVTHPNVCRMFEIHSADTPQGPVDFLAMEYVHGYTLSRLIRLRGKLPEPEAKSIALQICAGVSAAHSRNLLHRDLKPQNVLLAEDPKGGTRAVVTDFGLAQEPEPDSQFPGGSVPEGWRPAGTPAYLAPEQLRGEPATTASDIYALGIVLHEMVTGVRPGEQPVSLPPRWRPVIERCLHPDPARRFRSAADVAAALQGTSKRQWMLTAAAAFLIAAVIVWRALTPSTPPARLAVLDFEVQDGEAGTAALARKVSYDLSGRLMRLNPRPPQLVVIPLEETRGLTGRDVRRARDMLGASHVLRSAIFSGASGPQLRGAIVDTSTQVPSREISMGFDPADPSASAAALMALVSAAFNLPRQARAETVQPVAYADYTAAITLLRGGSSNYEQAAAAFEKAAALDPKSPLPHAGLAEACYQGWVATNDKSWLRRGELSLASAQRISPDSIAVRLAAGKLNLVPGSYERAGQEFQRAIQIDPNNAEAWRGLARACEKIPGRTNDAVAAYRKAIDLQPGYYLPHQDLGTFYRQLGNYTEAERHWKRVTEIAPNNARGHTNLGGLYAEMGRFGDSEREQKRALELDPRARLALNNLAALYQYMGRDQEAAALLERSIALTGTASHVLLLNLGDSYRRTGQAPKASEAYRRARALADSLLLDDPSNPELRAFLAYFALRLSDRRTAERELALALNLGQGNKTVLRRAVLCYEAMGLREKSLAVLQSATPDLLRELGRQPDLVQLRQDPRFAALNRQ
jgi:serine/threonine protein kinase/cytochrome c-type biogenesis protein CcmH/NrfG